MYAIVEQIDYNDVLLAVSGLGSAWQLRNAGSHGPESTALLNFTERMFLNTSTESQLYEKGKDV